MIKKFFKQWQRKKMIKANSSFILEEIAVIVNDATEHFEKWGQLKSKIQREALKFEATALVFWLFQKSNIFPELWHKLILDEIHEQYLERLRKHGYDFKMRQFVADDLNLRYKTYNDSLRSHEELTNAVVCTKFVRFLSERARTNFEDTECMMIPVYLVHKTTSKYKEWYAITNK